VGLSQTATAGTKRVGKLMRSLKWSALHIDRFLLEEAGKEEEVLRLLVRTWGPLLTFVAGSRLCFWPVAGSAAALSGEIHQSPDQEAPLLRSGRSRKEMMGDWTWQEISGPPTDPRQHQWPQTRVRPVVGACSSPQIPPATLRSQSAPQRERLLFDSQ
jgi:hypothetical protein